jgi:hypothetical protein
LLACSQQGPSVPLLFVFPTTVKNSEGDIALAKYLISPQGKIVLGQVGLNPVKPVIQGDLKSLPPAIREMIR